MAKVVQFPNATRSHEDAALWLARLDKGLSGEDHTNLRTWLDANPANRNALLELAALWDELGVLSELSALFPLEQPVATAPWRARGGWLLAGAAAALAIAVLVGYELRFKSVEIPVVADNRGESYETTVGGHATQPLSDGTVVTLNTDTEIGVAFVAQSRDVYLRRGEAHFAVAHDAARPFKVHVADRVLQAVGTAFNVHLRPDGEIELTVTEGTVKIATADAAELPAGARLAPATVATGFDATVVAGQLAILDEPDVTGAQPTIVELQPTDMDVKLAWQRGMMVFQGEPLPQMLGEFGRYTDTQFVLDGDDLRDVRVGGYFRAGDVDGLLLALRENFKIDSERLGTDRIVLRTAR